ncbi:hypothetical protein EW146_g9597, partial [Bondarzewia mesenterica]
MHDANGERRPQTRNSLTDPSRTLHARARRLERKRTTRELAWRIKGSGDAAEIPHLLPTPSSLSSTITMYTRVLPALSVLAIATMAAAGPANAEYGKHVDYKPASTADYKPSEYTPEYKAPQYKRDDYKPEHKKDEYKKDEYKPERKERKKEYKKDEYKPERKDERKERKEEYKKDEYKPERKDERKERKE